MVFSLQTSGGFAEGIVYESSLTFSSLCEFFLKKINLIVRLFFILCLFQRSNPPSVTLRGFENRGVVEMGDVSLTDNDDIENVSFFEKSA